jgi:hypothetical protein
VNEDIIKMIAKFKLEYEPPQLDYDASNPEEVFEVFESKLFQYDL